MAVAPVTTLTVEHIVRLTSDPKLYAMVPFLTAMRSAALRFHTQAKLLGCASCHKRRLRPTHEKIAIAFLSLCEAALNLDAKNGEKLAAYVKMKTGSDPDVLDVRIRYDGRVPARRLVLRKQHGPVHHP